MVGQGWTGDGVGVWLLPLADPSQEDDLPISLQTWLFAQLCFPRLKREPKYGSVMGQLDQLAALDRG